MRYNITCEGPGGTKSLSLEGGGTVTVGLAAGAWHIRVTAHYGEILAGEGEGDVEVRAGESNAVAIKLNPSGDFVAAIAAAASGLHLSSAKTAEGGAYGIGEPFQYKVEAMIDGTSYDITEWVPDSDINFDSSTAGTSIPAVIDSGSPLYGVSGASSLTVSVPVRTIDQRIAAVSANTSARLLLYADEGIAGLQANTTNISAGRDITLEGAGGTRTLSLNGTKGLMFNVSGAGAKLTLDRNVTLAGMSANTDSVVWVDSGGELVMKEGSAITGNTTSAGYGGGVHVNGGTFTMGGGTISGNTAAGTALSEGGGGVHVKTNSTFTMDEGTISGNTANQLGGGVHVAGSTFTMNGGTINGNTAGTEGGGVYVTTGNSTVEMRNSASISRNEAANGGGVYVASGGTFEMNDSASISGNETTGTNSSGGGVYVASGGTFEMKDSASISGNCASTTGTGTSSGGGVYMTGGNFTMTNGTISGNWTSTTGTNPGNNGGGVYMAAGTFTMTDGTISGNRTPTSGLHNGGGVYMTGGTFTMNGGTIGGDMDSNRNTAYVGGGVYMAAGNFGMNGGTIGGNKAWQNGGGVNVNSGTFTMNGSVIISGNEAVQQGGGVYVGMNGTFTLTRGTVYGNEPGVSLPNTVGSNWTGAAVYNNKNTQITVGGTTISGSAGEDSTISQ
jgi:hypothetical protein